MKITVNKNNEIEIFESDAPSKTDVPFLRQKTFPNGMAFESKLQAETWANVLVESILNPESEYLPGDSPDEPKVLRPEPVDPDTGLPIEPTDTNA